MKGRWTCTPRTRLVPAGAGILVERKEDRPPRVFDRLRHGVVKKSLVEIVITGWMVGRRLLQVSHVKLTRSCREATMNIQDVKCWTGFIRSSRQESPFHLMRWLRRMPKSQTHVEKVTSPQGVPASSASHAALAVIGDQERQPPLTVGRETPGLYLRGLST